MANKNLPRGLRRRIRAEKARLRRIAPDSKEYRERLVETLRALGVTIPLTEDAERAIGRQAAKAAR